MDIESLRSYCLAKQGATEGMPFGEEVLVFSVANKMFALTNLERLPVSVNLKCDPERAIELRERYASVRPGYHMNKRHWNTIELDGSIPRREIEAMIDDSYRLVVGGLKRAERQILTDNR